MPWNEEKWDVELRDRVRALILLRRQSRVLQEGSLRFLHAEADAIAFLREYTHGEGRTERAIVVASRRGETHEVSLTLPAGEWRDGLSGEILAGGKITLNAAGGRLLLQG